VSWSLKDYQENGLNAIKEAYFQALFIQQFTLLNLFKFLHILAANLTNKLQLTS
jgi:hypothetical protein